MFPGAVSHVSCEFEAFLGEVGGDESIFVFYGGVEGNDDHGGPEEQGSAQYADDEDGFEEGESFFDLVKS